MQQSDKTTNKKTEASRKPDITTGLLKSVLFGYELFSDVASFFQLNVQCLCFYADGVCSD